MKRPRYFSDSFLVGQVNLMNFASMNTWLSISIFGAGEHILSTST